MAKYNIARLQEFFLEMATDTYASGAKAARIPERPWEREFRRERGELTYIDRYVVNGEYSGGSTVILVEGVPAWLMQYHGWCKDDDPVVLNVLKAALLENYRRGVFFGGRGPKRWDQQVGDRAFSYGNNPEGGFTDFRGGEGIFDKEAYDRLRPSDTDDVVRKAGVFWHRYQGLLLGEPEK